MTKRMFFEKKKILEFGIVLAFILLGVGLRLLPHPPNFAPIAALALFGGVYLSRKVALILPLTIMLFSDTLLGGWYHLPVMASVYASFLLTVILGIWLKKHKKWYTIGGNAILAAVLFFVITNFAVWAFGSWYSKTFSGLAQCFVMALPFFKNTLLGNLFYSAVFFGSYEAVSVLLKRRLLRRRAPLFAKQKVVLGSSQ